jgi:hypothetical protein
LGTILHSALESIKQNTAANLQQEVDKRWHSLRFEAQWMNDYARRKARNMIENLAEYLSSFEAAGSQLIGAEVGFHFEQGDATVAGRIDRIEQTKDGGLIVVDLKTSPKVPSKKDVESNVQLLTYQLAVANKSLRKEDLLIPLADSVNEADGAKLVVIGGEKPETPNQKSFSEEESSRAQIIETINQASIDMAKNYFIAQIGNHCTARHTKSPCKVQIVEAVTYVD